MGDFGYNRKIKKKKGYCSHGTTIAGNEVNSNEGVIMNCSTAESMVNGYINRTLSVEELEEFLEHIEHCSSCRDELETYFIVHKAIQQLKEEDGDTVLDFKELLELDIRKCRRYIRKKKASRFFTGVFICLLIAVIAFVIFMAL